MKKQKNHSSFNILKNPYSVNNKSIAHLYHQYSNDPDSLLKQSDTVYYKIIQLFQLSLAGSPPRTVAVLDTKLQLHINDILMDEHGNHFTIKGFEMFRLSADEFPDWYLKISFVSIEGNVCIMGDYLTRVG